MPSLGTKPLEEHAADERHNEVMKIFLIGTIPSRQKKSSR
jgi:hypothetical protein